MTNYPSVEQLLDLFNWASPGMVVMTGPRLVVQLMWPPGSDPRL